MGDFLHVYIAISTCYFQTDKVLYVVIKNIDFQQFHLNGKEMIMLLICVDRCIISKSLHYQQLVSTLVSNSSLIKMNAFYWTISLKCFTLLYCYGKLLYSLYSYICSHFCELQSDVYVSLFLCNCHIHVSGCPYSDIIYRQTKSKLFLSKMLKDSYYLANSCKNCPSIL